MTSTKTQPIKSIRLVGTTWQRRGFPYWWRRAWLLVLWIAILAFSMWIVGLLFNIVISDPDAPTSLRITELIVMSAAVLWSFVWGFSLLRRSDAEKKLGVPMIMRSGATVEEQNRAGWRGYGVGLFAGPLILIAQLCVVGVLVALVISLMQKYISIEEFEAATGRRAPPRIKMQSRWNRRTSNT